MARLAGTTLEEVYERILARAKAAILEANDSNCFIGEEGHMPDVPDELAFIIIPSPSIPFTEKQEGGGIQTAEVTTSFTVNICSTGQTDAIGRANDRFRNATRGLWPQFTNVCRAFLDHDLLDASGNEMLSESIHAASGNSASFDRSFSALSVVFEMTFDLDLSGNVISFYNLNGNATDESGNGRNLTENGATTYTTGKINNAVLFSSSGDFLSIGTAAIEFEMPISSANSISCWIYANSLVSSQYDNCFAAYTNGDQLGQWVLGISGDNNSVYIHHHRNAGVDTDGRQNTAGSLISLATWHHIVVTHNNGTYKFYVDNVERAVASNASTLGSWGSRGFEIGRGFSSGFRFNGRVDMFGFWKKELSTDDIDMLFNSGSGKEYPFS